MWGGGYTLQKIHQLAKQDVILCTPTGSHSGRWGTSINGGGCSAQVSVAVNIHKRSFSPDRFWQRAEAGARILRSWHSNRDVEQDTSVLCLSWARDWGYFFIQTRWTWGADAWGCLILSRQRYGVIPMANATSSSLWTRSGPSSGWYILSGGSTQCMKTSFVGTLPQARVLV